MAKQRRYNGYLRTSITYGGKQHFIYAKTKEELAEKVVRKREELERGMQSVINPTLDEYHKTFIDLRRKQVKASTIRLYIILYEVISSVELSDGVIFGKMKIKDITRRHIEQVRDILLKGDEDGNNKRSAEYLNQCFKLLNHTFNSAVLDETIDKNPCKALKRLKKESKPISETKHRALTIEETQRFFDEARSRNSYYLNHFLMMIKTGLRIGELTALYYTDIDIKNRMIHVRRSVTRDEIGGFLIGENAKSQSGMRDIPLNDELIRIIQDQKSLNNQLFGLESNGLLFRSIRNDILKQSVINNEIKRICEATGIEPFTCHAFRNTFATRFIEQRPQDYKMLSELLGHKDISITLNLYTHVMTENKVIAMNELKIKTS